MIISRNARFDMIFCAIIKASKASRRGTQRNGSKDCWLCGDRSDPCQGSQLFEHRHTLCYSKAPERGLRTELVWRSCNLQIFLVVVLALFILGPVRSLYQRMERWHRSRRFRGAVESLDAVQKTLSNLAVEKSEVKRQKAE